MKVFGGIEAGGTKFVCMVASGPGEIFAETRFPTTTPAETLGKAIAFFREQARLRSIVALGVSCFGPVDLDPSSATYGFITTTPKPGWSQTDVANRLQEALRVPVAFDTDVNGAAWGEYRWGAAQNADPSIYLTIGTGIGGGGILNGRPMHGLVHPEMGHIYLAHDWQVDPFAGTCPYHGDCFEGLACGPALLRRWGQPAEMLPPEHPAWELEARYIALALANLICTLSPKKIILGGGVMHQPGLFPLVHGHVQSLLNGYVQSPAVLQTIQDYIVPPGLGDQAGVLGAIALAKDSLSA
jgi:fructokinase